MQSTVLVHMTLLRDLLQSHENAESGAILSKLFLLGNSSDKHEKRSDLNIRDCIASIRRIMDGSNALFVDHFLRGLLRLYIRELSAIELKSCDLLSRFDRINENNPSIHKSTVKTSTRKRPLTETPLAVVPEDALLMTSANLALELDNTLFPVVGGVSRTPLTGRRRLFNTPCSVSEDSIFEATPIRQQGDTETKRQKRMSSVSEVMDSLRADDGQRRLSGLLMTSNTSMPASPSINPDFETGIDPPSPWDDEALLSLPPLGSPSVEPSSRRRIPRKKTLIDKRGKWSIQIDPSKIQGRREWYLEESKFYISEIRVDSIRRFEIADIVANRTSHYCWYKPPTRNPTISSVDHYSTEELGDVADFSDEPFVDDEQASSFQPRSSSVSEFLATYKSQAGIPLGSLVELDSKNVTRRFVAANFMDLLHLVSSGHAQVLGERNLSFRVGGSPLVVPVN